MKLLNRTSRYFLLFSVAILAVGSTLIVFALNAVLTHQLDESLARTRHALRKELVKRDSIPTHLEIMDNIIDFKQIPKGISYQSYRDTVLTLYEEEEEEWEAEPFRKYVYTELIGEKNYQVELNQAKFEKEDLAVAMVSLIGGFLVIFLLLMNLFNRYISKQIWQPFYQIIEQIQQFSITDKAGIEAISSQTDEFELLGQSTSEMTTKLVKDYQALKRFSENASHELQTPLAIILARTDLLLQRPGLDQTSAQHLSAIQQASKRLAQLNRSLLLLTKIENQQFTATTSNDLRQLVEQEVDAFTPLIDHKQLQISLMLSETIVQCNTDLLVVLLQNLIGNAIKHNYEQGELAIQLEEEQLIIENTSHLTMESKPEELFDRFRKGKAGSTSLGLGLAIVQEICSLYNWSIHYTMNAGRHTITLNL